MQFVLPVSEWPAVFILTREYGSYTFYLRKTKEDVTPSEYIISEHVVQLNPPNGTIYTVEMPDGTFLPIDKVLKQHQNLPLVDKG